MKTHIIPHSRPTLDNEEVRAVSAVVRSGYIAQGKKVRELEEKLARFIGVKGAVAVNSGTSALHLALKAMGIGKGDIVLLPSYVCSAPLNAVYQAGAEPVLCDIETDDFNISYESIRDKSAGKAKVVIVPHMFGSPADLDKIKESGIPVIEDCAQSVGAFYGKKRAGSIGRFSIFSFYANKMLAAGEGGALVSDDTDILAAARDLRDYDEKEDYKVRYNYKMSDVQAALAIVQLKKLPGFIRKRKAIAAKYNKAFKDLGIVLPRGEFDHIYYRYVVRVRGELEQILSLARKNGVNCAKPVFKPLHRYFEMRSGFRNTDEVYSNALSIPIYPSLKKAEEEKVIAVMQRCFQ